MPRLRADHLVSALIRSVQAAGGNAAVLRRGDDASGAILLVTIERGRETGLLDRMRDPLTQRLAWRVVGPSAQDSPQSTAEYIARRTASDPDLWVVELDIAHAERFAAEMTGDD